MAAAPTPRTPRVGAVLRGDAERVTSLELFFDLVFVLAITQCTALMAADPTWTGLGKGALVLGVLWWAWVGYAWLTSVVDPEEGVVRIVIFAAMAAMLVVALAVPTAFGDGGVVLAGAYLAVRVGQIGLFLVASRDDPALRRSVIGLAVGTAVGTGLLLAAALLPEPWKAVLWTVALALDVAGPFVFGSEGWTLVPGHFAERHGLIVLIALGESIVAIGAGADLGVGAAVVAAGVLGVGVAAALFWLYFDVVALVAVRRLEHAAPGRERNEIARDSFSYLHFPLVLGIVLVALGFKKSLAHVSDPLHAVPAAALLGGAALYLLAHVAFRWRNVHRFSRQRAAAAAACVALYPVALATPAPVSLALLLAVLVAVIAYERVYYADLRRRLRAQLMEREEPAT